MALCHVHHTAATRGSRIMLHNDTPNLLRVVSHVGSNIIAAVIFVQPNSSYTFEGYQQGTADEDESTDVTFTVQRYATKCARR